MSIENQHQIQKIDKNTDDIDKYIAELKFNSYNLYKHQYSEEILIECIEHISLTQILKTQSDLSADFVINYILFPSEDQYITSEESYIDDDYVLRYQPHLKGLV